MIADNKATNGGLGVFDMQGRSLQFYSDGQMGNVDLREGFRFGGSEKVLVGSNSRSVNTLNLYFFDPDTRTLSVAPGIRTALGANNYGFCMYRSPVSGKLYGFVTPISSGGVRQFEILDSGNGEVVTNLVRTLPMDSITESCVADDRLGHVYFGQEDVAVWKYDAEPTGGTARTSVAVVGTGQLVPDIEGMGIAYGGGTDGYLFVASQGDSKVAMYERSSQAFVRRFSVLGSGTVDAVTGTDGLDVTSNSVGLGFEGGLLVVHDETNTGGSTSNMKFVPLAHIVRLVPPS